MKSRAGRREDQWHFVATHVNVSPTTIMMNSSSEHLCYRAYILRLWQERPVSPAHPAVWRFSVEDPRTGQRRGFGSLEGLVAYLRTQMEAGEQGGRGAGGQGRGGDKVTR